MTKDAAGKVIIRATRISTPITIDGQLDEASYRDVAPITEFVQQEPEPGKPMTEKTEAWIFFDGDNIYIACRCWDQTPEHILANDMRRDSSNLSQHDNFGFGFDTFLDGRTGVFLYVTAIGAMRDAAIQNLTFQGDWNPIWEARATRFDEGWIAEMAIPFKSLRYGPNRQQAWGIQLRRSISHKNEIAHLTPTNPQWGQTAVRHMETYGVLTGLEVPPRSRNLEIKPYAISALTTDLARRPAVSNDVSPDAGLDVKYGVTQALTADFTYNTDFAQVEADEAQVNLTRFSLSFPEKREFFIEGQGIFQFGTGGPGIGSGGRGDGGGGDAPTLFYSRRIGLSGSRVVPIIGGSRLSGRAGGWSIGALSITTEGDEVSSTPQTTFNVLRLRRDVLRRSTIGGMFSHRSASTVAPADNKMWGLDAGLIFRENVYVDGYVAQTQTSGRSGDDVSYRGQFSYSTDRYGVAVDRLVVERNFNPEIGFLRRQDFRRNFAEARVSPRTRDNRIVRRFIYQSGFEYTTNNNNRLESRELKGQFSTEFHNGDVFSAQYSRLYEFVPVPFTIATGVSVPVGSYSFENTIIGYNAGQQHRISGGSLVEIGSFFGGDKKTAAFRGRAEVTPQFSVEPNISLNWIKLPQDRFTNTVIGGRGTFSLTPRSFIAALVQYSSATAAVSSNIRLRWEYRPGSEMFIVYTDEHDTFETRRYALKNRGFVVKINRLFRF